MFPRVCIDEMSALVLSHASGWSPCRAVRRNSDFSLFFAGDKSTVLVDILDKISGHDLWLLPRARRALSNRTGATLEWRTVSDMSCGLQMFVPWNLVDGDTSVNEAELR